MELTYEKLIEMSVDDLRQVNQMVIDVIKMKKELLGKENVKTLSIGDEFKIDHKKHFGEIFIAQKINKKNVIGRNKKTDIDYNVPFSLIKRIS